MKYYEIHCSTPYCGEDNYYYFKTDDEKKVKDYAQECLYENGNEWYDEQAEEDYPDENDYYNECNYIIKEITKEEYEDECPWDKEDNMTISAAINRFSSLIDFVTVELEPSKLEPFEDAETLLGKLCYKLHKKGIDTLEDLDRF